MWLLIIHPGSNKFLCIFRQIFYEVLVTAGTEPAIRYLLDKIKDPEFRKANKALTNTFVENFHLSVKSPLVIPDIIVSLEELLIYFWGVKSQSHFSHIIIYPCV